MRISFSFLALTLTALATVAMLSGCASGSMSASIFDRDYKEARQYLDKGADPNETGKKWEGSNMSLSTPLCLIAYNSEPDCPSGLGKMNWKARGDSCKATWQEQMDFAKQLIEKGADVNKDCYGEDSLTYASTGSLGIFGAGLAKASQYAKKEYTPLFVAIGHGNTEMVKLLIQNKVKINDSKIIFDYYCGNNVALTPLMYANCNNQLEIAKLLLKAGANPSVKSSEGKTAKDYYAQYLEKKRERDVIKAQEAQAAYEQKQRDKAESREFWRGAATLATGVAVGNSTRNLSSDQQTQMMRSSMEAVQSGDASGLADTSNQIKAGRSTSTSASTIGGSTSNSSSSGAHYNLCSSRTDGYCSGGACTCNGPVAYGVCPSGYQYSATFRSMADCRTRLR